MRILLPKNLYDLRSDWGPLFFLAGPTLGAGDWRRTFCKELEKISPNFCAALPCRYRTRHPLMRYHIKGKRNYFDRQLTWERFYLHRADCIVFWLPCESKKRPRKDKNPYAMDTRGELGEWRGHLVHNPNLKVIVGAEPDFPGLSQIQRNFNLALRMDFPIYPTLAQTAAAAAATSRRP
jgi:hypothetical protein